MMIYVFYFAAIALTLYVYAYRYWKWIRYLWRRLRGPDEEARRGFEVLPPKRK
jgi:hypothetical protein